MFDYIRSFFGYKQTPGVSGVSDLSIFIDDDFWNTRIKTVATHTLPSMYDVLKKTGRWDFFGGNWKHIEGIEPHIFWDSDIAKFLEAVCYTMKYTDKDDEKYTVYVNWVEEIVQMAKNAQQEDGYLNTYFSQLAPQDRLTNIMEKHELYCCGHLVEAAVAHHEATGSMDLVNVMCKYVDLVAAKFGPEKHKLHGYPGHEEIELALVKLLRLVHRPEYYELLNYFVEERGSNNTEFFNDEIRKRGLDPDTYRPGGSMLPEPKSYWYYQAEKPIRELEEPRGHSVRFVYYLTGVQGLAILKNDQSLHDAVRRLFDRMVETKLYVHGGIGSVERWEGFGDPFELKWDGYSETCASIGLVLLCERMLAYKLDRDVALVMEKALYNDVLGGVSIGGDSYYYNQPVCGSNLTRQSWFTCACCPPNVARLFSSLEKYTCLALDDKVAFHLYVGIKVAAKNYNITFESEYPETGRLRITANSSKKITIAVREPKGPYTCTFDHEVVDGYIHFSKIWKNDVIEIDFDIPVEILKSDPRVEANVGHLAVQRGPYAYAVQVSGAGGVDLDDIRISENQEFSPKKEQVQNAEFTSLKTDFKGKEIKLVPYFVTGNEHPGEDFRMWIRESGK